MYFDPNIKMVAVCIILPHFKFSSPVYKMSSGYSILGALLTLGKKSYIRGWLFRNASQFNTYRKIWLFNIPTEKIAILKIPGTFILCAKFKIILDTTVSTGSSVKIQFINSYHYLQRQNYKLNRKILQFWLRETLCQAHLQNSETPARDNWRKLKR